MKLSLQNVFVTFVVAAAAIGFATTFPWIAGIVGVLVAGLAGVVVLRGRAGSKRDRERAVAYAAVLRGVAGEIGAGPRWGCAAAAGAPAGWELRWRRMAPREGFDVNRAGEGVALSTGEPARLLATMDSPVDEVQLRVPCPSPGRLDWSARGASHDEAEATRTRVAPGAAVAKQDGLQVWALGPEGGGEARADAVLAAVTARRGAPVQTDQAAFDARVHTRASDPDRARRVSAAAGARIEALVAANAPFLASVVAEDGWLTWRSVESTRTDPEALAALLPTLQAAAAVVAATG